MGVTFPDRPDQLSAEWLGVVLHVDVSDVTVTAVGTGQTGSSFRVDVTYAGPTAHPASFVAKLPAEDPSVRERVAYGYRAEVAFYQEVAATVAVPLPTCYFSAISDDARDFVLLLSDLAPAQQGDQLKGCDPATARPAVQALAGLHGPRWCDPSWYDFKASVMPRADAAAAAGLADIARMATDMFLDRLGPRMSAPARETLGAYPDFVARWLLLRPERFALLHGDYRLDNLLFAPDGGVTVVDWQTVSIGLPARDLAYFLSTSLEPEERASSERELVATYFEALAGHGVRDYSSDECWQDYQLGMLHAPLIATLGAAFSATTDRGDEMMLTMVERACAAIRDLDTLGLIDKESA